ncbi:MAG: DUF4157 domain-containing protein [Blastocatellia bacterium]|nr:DUF4157 domain-containing protein [Blastocatellia bacterium]
MISRLLAVCAWICILAGHAAADIPFGGANVHFASQTEGRQLLVGKDDFIRRLSPFDRSARMKVDRSVSEDEFLEFIGRNVVDWTKEEMQTVQDALDAIQPLVRDMPLSFPPIIQIIKTTGAEEGNAAYTRGTAIVFPTSQLVKDRKDLKKLICHELFHVLSRQNSELREKLYGVIGFKECDEIKLPPEIERRKITNPDAPRNNHFIRLKIDGDEHFAVPILLSSADRYDVKRGGEFFEYLQFHLLVLQKGGDSENLQAASENGSPRLVGLQRVSGFMEQVGRNTDYIIHPEEILAENFALLVLNEHGVRSPEILQKMREVLMRKAKI